MSLPKACCTLPPVESDYQPQGIETKLQDFTIYETGNPNSTKLLICVYDIFGFHPNTKQLCDKFGSSGEFRIVMPDFFRGSPWNLANFPPADRQTLLDWVADVGNYQKSIKADILNVIEHYKTQGNASSFGMFGFCWGGKISIQSANDTNDLDLKAVAIIHGAFLEMSDFENINRPVLFAPSKDEPDQLPFYNKVLERLGENGSEHYRFDDMIHGFAAARGDFKDELNRKRVDELIQYLHTFFVKHFK